MVRLQAVTFDFWNTLVYEERGHLRGRRLDAWAGVLEEAGYRVEREVLGAIYDKTWDQYVSSWKANQQFQIAEAAEAAVEALGFDVPDDVRFEVVDAFGTSSVGAELHVVDEVAGCLVTLRAAGVKTGIVCDVGFTPSHQLRDFLDAQGLLALFDAWAFSDDVGVYKPAPEIFRHVLDALGVDPTAAAHVGDLRRTDIAGAKALGMTAVRFTGVFDDDTATEPEADHVLSSHAQLPKALGITD